MQILLLCRTHKAAQVSPIVDSLTSVLATDLSDKQSVDVYNAIAHEHRSQDSSKTALFTGQAIQLARDHLHSFRFTWIDPLNQ